MFKNKPEITINKSFLLSLCFICFVVSVFVFNTGHAAAYELNENASETETDLGVEDKLENSQTDDVLQDSGKTFSDIREMIKNSKSGDTINLDGTYKAGSKNDVITIDKKLVIKSNKGAVLDGNGISSIFSITSNAAGLSISNIKFVNGYGHLGAAMDVRCNDVCVNNCEFENNYVDYRAGAVYVCGKDVEFNRCVFNKNHAEDIAGAIYVDYGQIPDSRFCIRETNFTYNSAVQSAGAAAVLATNSKLFNCIFDHNYVINDKMSYGGAIQMGFDANNIHGDLYNCIFTNNYAISTNGESHGGAGCVRNGSSYYNCTFINNSADHGAALTYHANGTIDNCIFINNTAADYGGALTIDLLHNYMNLNVTNCYFKGNKAPYGGAIKLKGMNIKIENSTFDDNYAFADGAAINIEAENVDVFNSKFTSNIAENDGGAIFIISSNTQIKDSTFISNSAVPNSKSLIDGLGGAIYINSTNALVQNNVFKFNTARNGSAIYYDKSGRNLKIINNTLFENQAWVYSLPILAKDIYHGESEEIKAVIYGGNNIARYNNLAVSNAIYNAADYQNIEIDGESPVCGATMSGEIYQDSREYNIEILLTVVHEDGTVIYNNSLNSNYLGEIFADFDNLKPGKYYVSAKHFNDTYYKAIENQTSFSVIPNVDVSVKISANGEIFDFEDIVVWTLNITNNGPSNATGVYLTEILPEGLILLEDVKNYDLKTGKLDIGDLNAGENMQIQLKTVVDKTGEISSKVNITSHEFDIDLSNNFDDEIIFINPASDLGVKKSVNKSGPNYGDVVQWTITVINNGPDAAHNVYVYDRIPDELELLDATWDYDESDASFYIGDLDVGQTAVIDMTTLVKSAGLIINNVSVRAEEHDYDLSNNNDSESIAVSPACDLAIIKSVNATSANYGDLIKWRLEIFNNGPYNATGVKIYEPMPDAFILISNSLNITLKDNYFEIGDLNAGEKLTMDIICKVNKTGNFTNFVRISGNQYDFDLSNNEDSQAIEINASSDLGVIKLVSELEPNYKDTVVWTITVYNNGPDTAHGVVVNDLFSNSLIWVSDDSQGEYNHNSGLWDVGILTAGEIKTLKITSIVNSTGMIENEVSVSGREFDYNQTNNHDVEVVIVNESADLSIVKSANFTVVNYGDLVKWTLIASNNGPSNATSVYVVDVLPEGLILVNYTASKGTYDEGKWRVCCLSSGESQTLEIISKVNKTGNITNSAEIIGSEYDPDSSNNEDRESILVPKAVDIEIKKKVNNTNPLFAEYILWNVSLKNNGPDNAGEVNVSEILSEGLIFVSYNATAGYYDGSTWHVPELAVGKIENLEILCIVNDLDKISNLVTANSTEYDWNKSNNKAEESINPNPVCDLSVVKSVDVSNANYHDIIKWTLTVLNNGPNNATGVVVEDILPYGFKLIKSNGNYDGSYWDVGNLNAGESKILDIVCEVESTGEFVNQASVYGNEHDGNLSNNYDDEYVSINPASDLAIAKKVSKNNFAVGDIIEFVIEVINRGPDEATNIRIAELWNDLLKIKSFETDFGKFDGRNLIWTIDNLGVGQKAVLHIKAVAAGEGIIRNEVSVTSDNYDYNLTNNNDYVVVNVTKKASDNIKTDNQNNSTDHNHKSSKKSVSKLEKYPTANPINLLVILSLFSVIFSASNISKKR